MRQEYELTEEDVVTIKEASKPVPYIAVHCGEPRSRQENVNDAWSRVGERIGFDYMTVAPVRSKGERFISAEAAPCRPPDPHEEGGDVKGPEDEFWPAFKKLLLTRVGDRFVVYVTLSIAGLILPMWYGSEVAMMRDEYKPVIVTFTMEEVAERIKSTRSQYEVVLPESGRFTKEEMDALVRIAWKESRWNTNMKNPASSSHGLFGFLKGTCRNYGGCSPDAIGQIIRAMDYIVARYGSPSKALAFHDTPQFVNGRWQYYY